MSNYAWLDTIGQLPRVIVEGRKLIGVVETPGPKNNPIIMGWGAEVGVDALGYRYTEDAVPWCGLYVAAVAKRAGKQIPFGPLYALNWSKFGEPVAERKGLSVDAPLVYHGDRRPSLGDVLVFRREGGGHVGFYIGEDDNYFCVLGGNQSDSVSITWIAKSRCVAVRRPAYTSPPESVKPYRLGRSGAISRNEA